MIGFGNALLWGGLAAALISLCAYVGAARGGTTRPLARSAFALSAFTALVATALLLVAFVQGHYEIRYVAEYSSRDLPLIYRVSALWAGQEGSFLLWALLGGILGLMLIRLSGDWEDRVMPAYAAVQAYLGLLLVAKSPFLPSAEALSDGHGLNPLLQDPWMAIHPPMIFLGYAALAVPFAFAIAALVWRDYDSWVSRALPWALVAWITLGAGIFIGGYWAYRVLGWGGYWGWDPVENASLIPWLLNTALVHTMLIQRARGSLKRANFLLASIAFATMIYGTFLTRSGVLKDFSVHSFVSPGSAVYAILLIGMILSAVGPLILFARRAREVRAENTYENTLSRDFAFYLGVLVLCVSAALVFVGTSAPIITSILGNPTSVQPRFYNVTHFPIAVLLALLAGIGPLLDWNESAAETVARRTRLGLIAAVVASAAALALGVHRFNGWMLILIAAAAFTLVAAGGRAIPMLLRRPIGAGGHLAHVGLALMLIGIVGSSICSRAEKISLQKGQKAEALGYQVTFTDAHADERYREVNLTLSQGSKSFTATPRMVFSPQMQSWVHSPAVRKYWLQDLYISPVDYRGANESAAGQAELGKGESAENGGYTFTFEGFDMAGGHEGAGIVIAVKQPSGKTVKVTPSVNIGEGGGLVPKPAKLPGTNIEVAVVDLKVPMGGPGDSRIILSVTGLDKAGAGTAPKEEVVVEVSNKPLINVLWLGSLLVLAGGIVASIRRFREHPAAKGTPVAEAQPRRKS